MKDVIESFVAIKASAQDIWPFVTHLDWGAMWASPLYEFHPREEELRSLDEGAVFDLVLQVPGRPAVTCSVLSRQDNAIRLGFEGPISGVEEWRIAPAGDEAIVHCRLECDLASPLWAVLWGLGGRWLAALQTAWLLRRLKGRVEDMVGSSRFGVPLTVSPYAVGCLVSALAGAAGLAIIWVLRTCKKMCKARR